MVRTPLHTALLLHLLLAFAVGKNGFQSEPLNPPPDAPDYLSIFYFTTDRVCLEDQLLYNFTHSVASAVQYVRKVNTDNTTAFYAYLRNRLVPGCTLQEDSRAIQILDKLAAMQANACDCSLINDWISVGDPLLPLLDQLYQISYNCQTASFTSVFTSEPAGHDQPSASNDPPPIARVFSQPIRRVTLMRSIIAFLGHQGWQRVALYYGANGNNANIHGQAEFIAQAISGTQDGESGFFLNDYKNIRMGMNITQIVAEVQNDLDAIVLLVSPLLGRLFLEAVQNFSRIQQGRIAIIVLDPSDLLTYDALRYWRYKMSFSPSTGAAEQSLFILTVLPCGTIYDPESMVFQESINLAVASATALAMRLVQLNLAATGGHLNATRGLFAPMHKHVNINVPTLPQIEFQFDAFDSIGLNDKFDVFIFSFKPEFVPTGVTPETLRSNYSSVFDLNAIIRNPLILPQTINEMQWPGDGRGPKRTPCLMASCGFASLQMYFLLLLAGFVPLALLYPFIVFVYRKEKLKAKRIGALTLIFYDGDLEFPTIDEDALSQEDSELAEDALEPGSSFQTIISTRRSSYKNVDNSNDVGHKNAAYLHGEPVFVKRLPLSKIILHSKLVKYLTNVRDIRHENINTFIGCFITADSFSLVFDFCPRGCLRDVIENHSVILDWEFKLSLIKDLLRGMDYLHTTSLGAHGRLKSTNCVVNGRWVLKITDFGMPDLFALLETNPVGSPEDRLWSAPELLRNESLALRGTRPADVYAFAIIMHEVLHLTKPFGLQDTPSEEILERVRMIEDPPFRPKIEQDDVPPAYIEILNRAWIENPGLRPTFKEMNEQVRRLSQGKKANIVEHMLKMMEKHSSRLEDMVRVRMGELENEKKKKEALIHRMLPPVVADALKSGVAVAPETYDEVSIYFSDIVGFTTISAMSTPFQVVDLLNDLYTLFDATIANYDVYKVETIGDAYMVASGLPVRNGRRHAGEVATMALDLLSGCGTFTIKHLPDVPMRLRIGLHTGPCVAGVVGLTMPRYCLFGDTVNQASKMESSGAAFRVHVSQEIKDVLDELGGYTMNYRGIIEFQGGITTTSYWLLKSDNFHKHLPEPPPLPTGDSHGLACVLPKSKLSVVETAAMQQ